MNLPYLTADVPGVGGVLRERPEDFSVTEIPAYEASGDGEHSLCEIQKTGISTFDALDRIGRALDVNPREIGFAGMKDAQAVTRQWLTVPRVDDAKLLAIQTPQLTVLSAAKHRNKLRLGHLKGNRFIIKIRDVHATDVATIKPALERLEREGMPNYFGEQRFGRRGDNDRLGAALLREDPAAVLRLVLGAPLKDVDPSGVFEARRFFENNDLEAAMKKWPRSSGMERRILARYINTKSAGKALSLLEPRLKRLWLSALQSRVFNDVVAERITALGKLLPGDLAYLHDKGACFTVEDVAKEQPRADAFEISATGPMLGYRMSLPGGEALALEQEIYDKFKLTREDFKRPNRDQAKGDRRPIRVKPADVSIDGGVDGHGEHITVGFTLPAGSFATVLLREVMKSDNEGDTENSSGESHED
jgi:tRNA pseudouridine13 synthase